MSDEMEGYRQQPGKLPFAKPGSGGSKQFSELRDMTMIPQSEGGEKSQPRGPHGHDELITGSIIGRRTPLIDSNWKVTGQAKYGDDIRLQGEIIGKILRSPHHHARIRSIDYSKAEALPGVLAIATGKEYVARFGVLPVTKDEHALAVDKVRHIGDLVACVAAIDEDTALEALRLIDVDYEILEAVHNISKGLDDADDPIHDRGPYHIGKSNIQMRVYQEFGRVS